MMASSPIRLIIADDHEIYRDGLVSNFQNNPMYELVAVCINGDQLVRTSANVESDVILTDLKMPIVDGVDAIRIIHKNQPSVRILVLSNFDTEYLIVEALDAGATGYITKSMPKKDLDEAIESVYNNVPYYCKTTTTKLARMMRNSNYKPYQKGKQELFTELEKQIIRQICEGKSCQQSGELLFMSARTVENHRGKIFKKMNVKSTAEVAIYAVKHNLFFMED
jgi:DNA-binding NarL/FixJ family response regulator